MKPTIDYTLYLVTDRALMSTPTLAEAVNAACAGGVTLVQLREKHVTDDEYVAIAREVKAICDKHGVPLIINDNPNVAVAVDAAGVHVGQEDLEASRVRDIVGPDAIVGVSAASVAEARAAQAAGADYLGVGAIVATATKPEAGIVTRDELTAIIDAVDIPVVAIGGVNAQTIPTLAGLGLAGYSVVSAIITADDIKASAADLHEVIAEGEGR
ncbi:MAG: thiamine phosphate synthase [Coriobacteriales bacterium]